MIELIRFMKCDLYKLCRSGFLWLHILFPIFGAGLVLLYASFAKANSIEKVTAFFQIIAIAYPFVISVICSVTAKQEIKAGNCQNILILSGKIKALLSKFLIMTVSGLLSAAFSTTLFAVFFCLIDTDLKLSCWTFIFPSLVLWSCNIPLYALHLLVAFYFGRNVCIGIGGVGSLLAALLQTGLGTGLWFVLPYGFGVRLTEYALINSIDSVSVMSKEIKCGIGCCIGMTCFAIFLMIVGFTHYSGKLLS